MLLKVKDYAALRRLALASWAFFLFGTLAAVADDTSPAAVASPGAQAEAVSTEAATEPALAPHLRRIFEGEAPVSLADLRAMEEHVRRLADRLQKSTVGVRVGPAHGSGVIIRDNYVLTAGHVIGRPGRDAMLILQDGRAVRGKTLGLNVEIDSGLMEITEEGEFPAVEMGDSSKLKRGQWVLALGHPGGYETGRKPVLRMGRILDVEDTEIRTDCTLVGGDSGGPLFDMEGRVIAIHSRIGGALTANIHVPIATYKDTWDRLAAGESWGDNGNPFIGVHADPDTQEARIAEVVPGGPADLAGVKAGDTIVKIDGREIPNFAALAALVRSKRPGDRLKVEVRRMVEGQAKTVELELEVGRLDN